MCIARLGSAMPASALLLRLLLCSAGSRQARGAQQECMTGRAAAADAVALQSGESPLFNATALESPPLSPPLLPELPAVLLPA